MNNNMALEVYAHLHPDDPFNPLDNITIVKDGVKIELTGAEWNRIKSVLKGEEGIAFSSPNEGSYTPHTAFVWTKTIK